MSPVQGRGFHKFEGGGSGNFQDFKGLGRGVGGFSGSRGRMSTFSESRGSMSDHEILKSG